MKCGSSAVLIAAGISFAAGILVAVFLPNIVIVVILTLLMLIMCLALLK